MTIDLYDLRYMSRDCQRRHCTVLNSSGLGIRRVSCVQLIRPKFEALKAKANNQPNFLDKNAQNAFIRPKPKS